MDIVPLGPGFAAELRGVTLADVASDEAAYAAARAAFEEHSVLVLRDQEVTDELQLAFSRRFGPPEVTKVGSQGTGSHFVILSTIGPDGKVVPPDHLVRQVEGVLDLSWVHKELAPYYSHTGRPSIDPVLMIRMLIVGYVFAIRSERRLCSEVQVNLAYRCLSARH